ncbi:PD-(D/E)XK nuclease family protein [Actinoplanes sp. NPDC023714]|uniref:RecB family exonuclease n=1 Tax=Actinoplanes sp. NPDC023714 TaxID=3154322 RepID=UPI0033E7C2D0
MTAHPSTTAPAAPAPAAPAPSQPGGPRSADAAGQAAPSQPGAPSADAADQAGPRSDADADQASPGRGRRPETPRGPSLSPSRAADFKTCPLLFRFRTIDKLPELPTADQVRGTLVHAVLERLFDLPAGERTPAAAAALVAPEWAKLLEQEPSLAEIFTTPLPAAADPAAAAAEADATGQETLIDIPPAEAETARLAAFLSSATALLDGYFAVEDPQRLQPAERETLISTVIGDELLLRGYIDRLDVSPAGDMRVVDYKTGGAPREAFEGRALFQLKFYALVLWRTRGVVPRVLRLLYLKDAEALDYSPEAGELERFERTLTALSAAIERAKRDQDFRPKPSRLCGWCRHQKLCPEFGGTPPPFPDLPEPATALTLLPDDPGPRLRDDPLG